MNKFKCYKCAIFAKNTYSNLLIKNFPLENRAQILKLASFLECQGILKCLLGQIREQHFGTRQNQPSPDSGHQSPEIKMEPQEDPGHVTLHRVIRLAQPNQSEGHGFCNSSAYSSPPHSEEDEDNSEERTKSDPDDIKQVINEHLIDGAHELFWIVTNCYVIFSSYDVILTLSIKITNY